MVVRNDSLQRELERDPFMKRYAAIARGLSTRHTEIKPCKLPGNFTFAPPWSVLQRLPAHPCSCSAFGSGKLEKWQWVPEGGSVFPVDILNSPDTGKYNHPAHFMSIPFIRNCPVELG